MPRIIADLRNPEEKGWWQSERALSGLRRLTPDDPVEALDKITARCLSRLHEKAQTHEIRATGLVEGVPVYLDPEEWFGGGRSRVDFVRHRLIRTDGKEAVGLQFTIGTSRVSLTPIETVAWLAPGGQWGFLKLLAETVLGRLGRGAVDAETGEHGAASVAWWMSLDKDEHVALRLAAQEAFARGETHSSVDPPAQIAEKEPSETATLTSVATGSRSTTAEPKRRRRVSNKRDPLVSRLVEDYPTEAALAAVKITVIQSKYGAKRTTASEARKAALKKRRDDPTQ
jgi:hypothetical protein